MNLDYLDFEQPIAVLEAKIEELQLVSDDNALNIAAEIATLREKSRKLTESIYSNLSSWQVVQIARHPLRPYTSDYIPRLFTEFDELHGDRQFGDLRGTQIRFENDVYLHGGVGLGYRERTGCPPAAHNSTGRGDDAWSSGG